MKFTEANIREYIRTHEGFEYLSTFTRNQNKSKIETSVQTLVDLANFFAKAAAEIDSKYEHLAPYENS